MLHPVRGVLTVEGIQTGDGRYFNPGALTWVQPPLPIAWMRDGDQHIDLSEVAPQIGTINQIARVGGDITFAGIVDDAIPDGAELLRRLDAGSAGFGQRVGVSIDGDDWALELVWNSQAPGADEDDGIFLFASDEGPLPEVTEIVAAAGQGDIMGEVLFTDASDLMVMRFSRLRIRGVTACAVPAFAEAYMERAAAPAGLLAAASVARPEPPFPAAWFTDPGLDGPTPVQVTAEGRVLGHIATWETCHIGFTDRCVAPPHSESDYEHAHRSAPVDLDDGSAVRVGHLTVGTGHAPLTVAGPAAAGHYDDTGSSVALVRYGEDEHGIWCAGVVNPNATHEQVLALRTSAPSGDWRRLDGNLELVATLMVNTPGFPVRDAIAASAGGECVALIAAGSRDLGHVEESLVFKPVDDSAGEPWLSMGDLEARVAEVETFVTGARRAAAEERVRATRLGRVDRRRARN